MRAADLVASCTARVLESLTGFPDGSHRSSPRAPLGSAQPVPPSRCFCALPVASALKTTPTCRPTRSLAPPLLLVVVRRIHVEFAEQFDDLLLLASLNVLTQRLRHRRAFGLLTADP